MADYPADIGYKLNVDKNLLMCVQFTCLCLRDSALDLFVIFVSISIHCFT